MVKLGKLVLANPDGSLIIKVSWGELKKYNLSNWNRNREPDDKRIPELAEYIKGCQTLDHYLYISYTHDEKLIYYDGAHRIEALKLLSKTNNIDNYLFLIHLRHYDEKYMIDKFNSLNKSISLPEIYQFNPYVDKLKNIILSFVRKYRDKHINYFKNSKRPQLPHENRDTFTDKLTNIIKELKIQDVITEELLDEYFRKFNMLMKLEQAKNLTTKQKKKCNDENFFVFCNKYWDKLFINYYNASKLSNNSIV